MHYVIGDIHGCFDELMRLLDNIESYDPEAIIYFVGDFVDRGPKVWEVLTWIMQHITPDGKYRSVRGNHEQMVLDWYEQWKWWRQEVKGTDSEPDWKEPKTKYDFYEVMEKHHMLEPEKLEPVMDFFKNLPYNRLITVTNVRGEKVKFRIAHAWHYQHENISFEDQIYANLWERKLCGNTNSGEIIVHGHTPNLPDEYWPWPEETTGKVFYEEKSNSINVDGGCCYKKWYASQCPCMLCGICLETLEEFYPCTFEERFAEFKEQGYIPELCEMEELPAFIKGGENRKPDACI